MLPGRVTLSGVYMDLRGNLTGVNHLVVGNKSTVDFEQTSTTNLRGDSHPFGSWDVEDSFGEPNVFAFESLAVEDNSRVRLREKSRLYVWNMTVGSRSFEHPINGTTRRRLSGLVDVAASSNALTCSQGSKCDFVREVQRGDRLWVGNQEFTVYDHHEHNSNTYFHPGKVTLGKKGDSGSEHHLIPLQLVESLSTHIRECRRGSPQPHGKWRHSL